MIYRGDVNELRRCRVVLCSALAEPPYGDGLRCAHHALTRPKPADTQADKTGVEIGSTPLTRGKPKTNSRRRRR